MVARRRELVVRVLGPGLARVLREVAHGGITPELVVEEAIDVAQADSW